MEKKVKKFEQYLVHEINDYKSLKIFLKKTAPIIGFIVHRFNTLEVYLNTTICTWFNSSSDSMGLLVINKMNYSSKVDLLNKINIQFQNDNNLRIETHINLILKLREAGILRNAIIHADWENTDFEGYTHVNVKINESGIQQEYLQFDDKSLKQILVLINETIEILEEYWHDTGRDII